MLDRYSAGFIHAVDYLVTGVVGNSDHISVVACFVRIEVKGSINGLYPAVVHRSSSAGLVYIRGEGDIHVFCTAYVGCRGNREWSGWLGGCLAVGRVGA